MKTVVVGGHSRNIGKTSVMAGLISNMNGLNWTAVKITQYGHGICSLDGEPCGCAPTEHAHVLTEERDASGQSDTSRFLAAGARRSFWLRVRQGQLADAFPILDRALGDDDYVMIESNSVLSFMTPSLYLVVLDRSQADFKPSALRFLDRADALVPIGTCLNGPSAAWPLVEPGIFVNKPKFPMAPGQYSSPDLCEFVRLKLVCPASQVPTQTPIHQLRGKEQTCQH
ncbi:MAG TPA: hypothetical protein VKV95_02090 [Terriglobia bacterium]|nr:hypothetical protein [Terriglobia bacterium]